MARDTFRGASYCLTFLIGWILEKRFVRFSTDVSLQVKTARVMVGLLGYYLVNLVICAALKNALPQPAATIVSSFVQIIYVVFVFPWIMVLFEKASFKTDKSKEAAV